MTAGPHKVGVTFIARTFAESDVILKSFTPVEALAGWSGLEESTSRPFSPAGMKETPSRARIFVCKPANPNEELPRHADSHQRRKEVYRRPVTERDLTAPLAFYRASRNAEISTTGSKTA